MPQLREELWGGLYDPGLRGSSSDGLRGEMGVFSGNIYGLEKLLVSTDPVDKITEQQPCPLSPVTLCCQGNGGSHQWSCICQ